MPTTLDDIREIAKSFPGIEEGTSYGTPAFRARQKFFSRLHDNPEWFVLKVGELEQAFLIETEPEIYHITDHYVGTSLVLIRLEAITPQSFRAVFTSAWRRAASKRDLAAYEQQI